MWHSKGKVSLGLDIILKPKPMMQPDAWAFPSCSSIGGAGLIKNRLLTMDCFDYESPLVLFDNGEC